MVFGHTVNHCKPNNENANNDTFLSVLVNVNTAELYQIVADDGLNDDMDLLLGGKQENLELLDDGEEEDDFLEYDDAEIPPIAFSEHHFSKESKEVKTGKS